MSASVKWCWIIYDISINTISIYIFLYTHTHTLNVPCHYVILESTFDLFISLVTISHKHLATDSACCDQIWPRNFKSNPTGTSGSFPFSEILSRPCLEFVRKGVSSVLTDTNWHWTAPLHSIPLSLHEESLLNWKTRVWALAAEVIYSGYFSAFDVTHNSKSGETGAFHPQLLSVLWRIALNSFWEASSVCFLIPCYIFMFTEDNPILYISLCFSSRMDKRVSVCLVSILSQHI